MADPNRGISSGNGMPVKCSKCGGESTMDRVLPGPDGKPLCKNCSYDLLKQWKPNLNSMEDLK